MLQNFPSKLPREEKQVWVYSDCFPDNRPLKLNSIFCHRNYEINMHAHDFYEINIAVNGTGMHYTDQNHYPVSQGDVVVIPPERFHGYKNVDSLAVFHVILHKNYLTKYAGDLNVLPSFHFLFNQDINLRSTQALPQFHLEEEVYNELLSILYQLDDLEQRTNKVPDRADYLITYSLTMAVVVILCKEYARQYSTDHKNDKSSDIGIIAVTKYIHANYMQKITLDDLCHESMMSKTQLCEKFHKYFGLTPLNYVNRYRVLVAKNLIIETDKSIAEIAQETGFYDLSHFLKNYLKYETESPTALRKRLKQKIIGTV